MNAALNLPLLTGTEKQIAWATQIRDTAIAERFAPRLNLLTTAVDKLRRRDGVKPELTDEFINGMILKTEARIATIRALAETASAGWWIDNQHNISNLIAK